jgi:hypothetical protein
MKRTPTATAAREGEMGKQLKLWNGRCYGVVPRNQWKRDGHVGHVYVAAYSANDVRRLCRELGLGDPGAHEIKVYWNKGSWGNSMAGITPERGVWIGYGPRDKPTRLPLPGEGEG